MSPEVRRSWLKLQTRLLIKAVGGLEVASAVCEAECRSYSVAQLSRCQTPTAPDMLPLDIVDCLESYCGQRIVSRALASTVRAVSGGNLRDEASDVTEAAADLQKHVRIALADDGVISPQEAAELMQLVEKIASEAAEVKSALLPLLGRGVV